MEVIKAFESLPMRDRLAVARKIQLKVADQLFEKLDAELPDLQMSTEEIQEEINASRREKKQEAQNRP